MATDPVPESPSGLIPYLLVDDAAAAIEFYKQAFDAEETYRLEMPGGQIGHASMRIGDATIFLADDPGDFETRKNPKALGGTPVMLTRYVDDVDAVVDRAKQAGAEVVRPPEDQFYGDRAGSIVDPWGHEWSLHTHVRDVSEEEMQEAIRQMAEG